MVKNVKRAGCIVCYENQILLVHQKESNFWGFPKGRLNKNEGNEYRKCAVRELYEEAGVNAREVELGKCIRHNQIRFYILNLREKPQVKIDNFEIDNHVWVDKSNLSYFNMSNSTKFVYKKLL